MASPSPDERAKRAAAARAVALVEEGMVLGFGTGSTADWFVRLLGERVRGSGLRVRGVATSDATEALARAEGLDVVDIGNAGPIDLTVDGADEIDARLNLIKGGGGALLREKIVAAASARMVVIADSSKRVQRLGAFPLPVEVVHFGWTATQAAIAAVLERANVGSRRIERRMGGGDPVVTAEGHYLLDLHLGWIEDPSALAAAFAAVPGVVEHGLFLGMADLVLLGREDESVDVLGGKAQSRAAAAAEVEAMRNQDA